MDYKELKTPAKPAAPKAAKAPAIVEDDDLAHSGLTKSAKRRNAKKKRQAAAVARSKAVLISVAVETVQTPTLAAPKARLCMVCGDAIDPAALFYDCAKSEEHTQCLSCFADYVRHCCNHYWAGKFPLRCPVPNCKTHVDDLALRHLLAAAPEESVIISTQPNRSLWSLYERSQLEAALADWSLQGDDTVVRCTSCNKYAEIFPKDYHSRANHIVKAMNAWKREREWRKLHPEPPKGMEDFPSEPIFGYMAQDFNDQAFVDEVPTAEQASRPIAIERYVPDPAIGMTGHFFECKTPECDASVCLRCNSFLSKAEQGAHVCAPDIVHELYLEVLDTLAEASTKTCPRCKRAGMKDLACCNISCDCGTTWCYACAKVPNGDHFGYTMLQEKEKCPSYLQYKYGDDINGSHFNGDPQKALERFHVAIQMDAINKLKSECKEPALWDTVMRKHFPKGIWAPSMLEWFEKREAYIKERRQKAEEAKNQNKPAAPAPAPQPAVHNDDDDVGLGLFD